MKRLYRIRNEPADESYRELIDVFLEHEESFCLVWREQLDFSESAWEVRARLKDLQVKHTKTDAWPANKLIGRKASVAKYRCCPEASEILYLPNGLYGWHAPEFPEDLFFLSDDTGVSLATVTHESESWIVGQRMARRLGQTVTLELETEFSAEEMFGL